MGKSLLNSEYVILGKIGAPFGIQGWTKVISYTQPRDNLFGYSSLVMLWQQSWKPIDFLAFKPYKNHFIARIARFDEINLVQALTNVTIGMLKAQLPPLPENEYYWEELFGLDVFDETGKCLGQVSHLIETGSNDVLVIKGDKERLIPYLDDFVLEVNIDQKRIDVSWDD